MLDSETKEFLWESIFNVYNDSEQLEIIQYLVELLKGTNEIYIEENSLDELYNTYLEKILNDIKELKEKEHDYFLTDKEN